MEVGPNFIVNENEILTFDQMRTEIFTYKDFSFSLPLHVIRWLVRRHLHNTYQCLTCNIPMSFVKRSQLNDEYRWKCRSCGKAASIRKDSFFSKSHLSLEQIITIVYGWCRDYGQQNIAHEAGVSNHTLVDWCMFCREVCEQYLEEHPNEVGGFDENGISKVVEIDETKYFHRKYHRKQWHEEHWVFGGIERGSGKCFMVEVPNKNEETLINIIQQYILPGTTIVSDGSRAYRNIKTIGGGVYVHKVIIHKNNYVNPNNPNTWMRGKCKLKRQLGTSVALFESYIHEFIYRNQKKNNFFMSFLIDVCEQYPV